MRCLPEDLLKLKWCWGLAPIRNPIYYFVWKASTPPFSFFLVGMVRSTVLKNSSCDLLGLRPSRNRLQNRDFQTPSFWQMSGPRVYNILIVFLTIAAGSTIATTPMEHYFSTYTIAKKVSKLVLNPLLYLRTWVSVLRKTLYTYWKSKINFVCCLYMFFFLVKSWLPC